MKRAPALLPLLLLLPLSGACQFVQPTCSTYNNPTGPFGFTDGDSQQHFNGEHFDTGSQSGTCSYTGGYTHANTAVACGVTCKTSYVATVADTGVTLPYTHEVSSFPVLGIATSGGTSFVQCAICDVCAFLYRELLFLSIHKRKLTSRRRWKYFLFFTNNSALDRDEPSI